MTTPTRKHICILSLALPIEVDPRTGRQVDTLQADYEITLIGFGIPKWKNITWRPIDLRTSGWRQVWQLLLLIFGRVIPRLYEVYFWTRPRYRQCLAAALASNADVYHACDWAMLPIAARAAQVNGAKVVIDLDEYFPLFTESSRLWLIFFAPMIRHMMHSAADAVDAASTVCQPFAERYGREYGWSFEIIYNAPYPTEVPYHATDPAHVRLIHHGAAQADRLLENLVEALPLLEPRFTLSMLLTNTNPDYTTRLKALGDKLAPGRFTILETVWYEQVVATIAQFDIELSYVAPTTYHYLNTLPNKVFEAIMAGLGVLTGPSPAMAEIVRQHRVGWVANGFAPADIAAALNALTWEDIEAKRHATRAAARLVNGDTEQAKISAIYQRLFAASSSSMSSIGSAP